MISGRDIVVIASIDWGFLWQGHQEIALRLANAGNRVLFIENTGVRAPRLNEARRVAGRLSAWLTKVPTGGVREVAPNLWVASPLMLPPFGTPMRRAANRFLFIPMLARLVRKLRMNPDLIWTYLPTDTGLTLMRAMRQRPTALVYYCVDNFSRLTPYVTALQRTEQQVLSDCDLVFTTEARLEAQCRRHNANVHVFPFGVNLDNFPAPAAGNGNEAPDELARLGRPIVGYVGGLHQHVDYGLLASLARMRHGWSWVYVGKVQSDVGPLAELPNVYLLGQQNHDRLAAFIREFDACLVPYVQSAYTETVVPTKINEYLACGKPVVCTPIPAVMEFNARHNVLSVAEREPAAFLAALEVSMNIPPADGGARRRQVAELSDWGPRLEQMAALVEAALSQRRRTEP